MTRAKNESVEQRRRRAARRRELDRSEKGRARKHRYAISEKGIAADRRFAANNYRYRTPGDSAERGEQYRRDNPLAYAAHCAVSSAIRAGQLPPAKGRKCSEQNRHCKKVASEYHHDDYEKPLDVRPVCRPCNRRLGS